MPPSCLQQLIFGRFCKQSLKDMSLPGGFRQLTIGYDYNQSLKDVSLPLAAMRGAPQDMACEPPSWARPRIRALRTLSAAVPWLLPLVLRPLRSKMVALMIVA